MSSIHQLLPDAEPVRPPRLSAVLVICGDLAGGAKSLALLASQTAAADIELILASDLPETLEAALPHLEGFAARRRILGDVDHLPWLRAGCIGLARAPFIGFCEDHSFLERNWAEEMIASFESDDRVLGVAPGFLNPNDATALSRVLFAYHFGRYDQALHPGQALAAEDLPWHNTGYRRDDLLALGTEAGHLLEAEMFLQRALLERRPDGRWILNSRTATRHVNASRARPAMGHALLGGRLFSSRRAARERWSVPRRLLQAAATPLIPPLKLWRHRQLLARVARGPLDHLRLLGWGAVIAVLHACGETIGTFSPGRDLVRDYSDFECRRTRYVRRDEIPLLLP